MHDLQHAYIIDMGFATLQTDETILFAGAVQTASNRVLEALQKKEERFQYKFADDLESLVKVSLFPHCCCSAVAAFVQLSFNFVRLPPCSSNSGTGERVLGVKPLLCVSRESNKPATTS